MEPLSAVASIIALTQAAEKLVSAGKFAKSIGQIPKEYIELLDDLRINQVLAHQIDQRIHQGDVTDGEMLSDLSTHLNGSVSRLEELIDVVKRSSRACEGEKSTKVSTLRWQMNKSELANINASMKQTKDNLQLCLQLLSSTHVALVLQRTLHMERNISTLQEALTRFSIAYLGETHDESHTNWSGMETPQKASIAISQTETQIEPTPIAVHSQPQTDNPSEDIWGPDQPEHCSPFCTCYCHDLPTRRPLSWIEPIVGSLVINTNTSPLFRRRACNNAACKVPSQCLARFRYTYPQWYARRVVDATMSWGALSGTGATLHLRVPRVVGPELLFPIVFGQFEKFKQLLLTRAFLPADVDRHGHPLITMVFYSGSPYEKNRLRIYEMLMEFGVDLALSGPTGSGVLQARQELRLWGSRNRKFKLPPEWIPALRKAAYGNPQARVQPVRWSGVLRAFFEGNDNFFEAVVRSVDRENLDFIDECGLGAIHYASSHGRTNALRILLDAGADVELCGIGLRPVNIALRHGIPSEILVLLLQNGADPNDRTFLDTPIICLTLDQPEKMRILLDHGAHPIVPDSEAETPYHNTRRDLCRCSNEATADESIQILHQHGVGIDHQDSTYGSTPLINAFFREDIMALKSLIRHGARLDLTTSIGLTILHIAAMLPEQEAIDILRTTANLSDFEPDQIDLWGCKAEDLEPPYPVYHRRPTYTRRQFADFCEEIRVAKYGPRDVEEDSDHASSELSSVFSDEEGFVGDADGSGPSSHMPGNWPRD